MVTYLLIAFAFAAGFFLVFGANLLIADVGEAQRQRRRDQMMEEARLRQKERAHGLMQFQNLGQMASEQMRLMNRDETVTKRFRQWLDQTGRQIKPLQLIGASLLLAAAAGLGAGLASGSLLLVVCLVPLAAVLPFLWIVQMRRQRLARLQEQLPDAFDLMGRTMRAGQTISQALQSVADEAGPPLSEEFLYCYEQQELGMSPESALHDLAWRTGLLEIKIFVLAVMIHRETGGNLSELLEKLSQLLRQRERTRGLITSLTAEGQMQAFILFSLPFLLMGMMAFVNRSYLSELLQHPALLTAMGILLSIGMAWMQKIVNFDY